MEEKTFNRKFVYILLGIATVIVLGIYLVVINANGGSSGLGNSLNGTYYKYEDSDNVVITDDDLLKISGEKTALYGSLDEINDSAETGGVVYKVDTESKTITKDDGYEYPYTFKNNVLRFADSIYVKKRSEKFKKAKKMKYEDFVSQEIDEEFEND